MAANVEKSINFGYNTYFMASTNQRIERERLQVPFALAGLASLFTSACRGGETSRVQTPEQWQVVPVEAGDKVIVLDQIGASQHPYIGLDALVMTTSARLPLVSVITFWNDSVVRDAKTASRMGFQPIRTPFELNADQAVRYRNVVVRPEDAVQFQTECIIEAERVNGGPFIDGVHKVITFPRPLPESTGHALVFQPGFVNFNGRPSPASYVSARFQFASQLLDTI